MAHHVDNIPPILNDWLRKQLDRVAAAEKLGATHQFPQGHLNQDDEGELRFGVTHTPEKVILNFGKAVAWIGFDAQQADELGDLLKKHAAAVRYKTT